MLDALRAALADRYELRSELGAGGMATVWLARDLRHDRAVAIKVLHPDLAAVIGPERFLREIRLTASLQHPNVLPLFDSGAADGLLYYVMPFVDGPTLRGRLARDRVLPVEDALQIARELAAALQYAHSRGIVHRDVKPENVLLQDGRPLLADFGIALAAEQASGARMTQSGLSLGTPQYMAPEQAMGERDIDARADIFALGAVTYEMLTGEPPFTGATAQAVMARMLTVDPAPIAETRSVVAPAIDEVVRRALRRLPADRYQSMLAFAQALDAAVRGEGAARVTRAGVGPAGDAPSAAASFGTDPTPLSLAATSRWRSLAATAVAGATVGALALWFVGKQEPIEAGSSEVQLLVAGNDSLEIRAACCGRMAALSPDGRTLVFQGAARTPGDTAAGATLLYVRALDRIEPRVLPGTENATSLSFSRDGRELAFVSGRRLFRVPLLGGTPQVVATLPAGFINGTDWIDADRLLVSVGSMLYDVPLATGTPQPRMRADSLGRQPSAPVWIAEGRSIAFSYASLDLPPEVHWLPDGDSVPRPLMRGSSPLWVAAWRALVVNRDGTLLAYPFDPERGDTLGPPRRLADRVPLRSPVLAFSEHDLSPSGALVITRRGERGEENWRMNGSVRLHEGERVTPVELPDETAVVTFARFSPDGSRLALTARGLDWFGRLYLWDRARQTAVRLSAPPDAYALAWTAGGDSLLFAARGTAALYSRAADGSGDAIALPGVRDWATIDHLSVRDTTLLLSGTGTRGAVTRDIAWIDRRAGGRPTPFLATPFDELDAELSPDGRWVAFASDQSGRLEVYLSPFPIPSRRVQVSTDGGRRPEWSADGRTLVFAGASGGSFWEVPLTFAGEQLPAVGAARQLHSAATRWTREPNGPAFLSMANIRLLRLVGFEWQIGGPSPLAAPR